MVELVVTAEQAQLLAEAKDSVGPFAPLTPPTFKSGTPFFRHE